MMQLETIARNGPRLDSLINDLLDLSRIENDKIKLDRQWFEIAELITEAARSFEPLLEPLSQTLRIEADHGPAWIEADRDRITQAITNLLSNASKYSSYGSEATIKSMLDGGRLRVSVTDRGAGIRPEDQEYLFTLFFRTKDAEDSSTSGTEIGLFVSKRLIELHGGDMQIESVCGEGTTVSFTLPGATDVQPTIAEHTPGKQYRSRFDDLDIEEAS